MKTKSAFWPASKFCSGVSCERHSEIKKWLESSSRQPVTFVSISTGSPSAPLGLSEQRDHKWLQERTAAKQ